jgi:hypothetical protein
LTDHDHAAARRFAADGCHLATGFGPDHETHAAAGETPKLAERDRRLPFRVDDLNAYAGRRAAACKRSVRIRSGKPKRDAARATERRPAVCQIEDRTDGDDFALRSTGCGAGSDRQS